MFALGGGNLADLEEEVWEGFLRVRAWELQGGAGGGGGWGGCCPTSVSFLHHQAGRQAPSLSPHSYPTSLRGQGEKPRNPGVLGLM